MEEVEEVEQVATYDEITRNQFKFSSKTTEYFFPVFPIRNHLDLKTFYRRFTISDRFRDRFNRVIQEIYDMKRDDNGNFELTYGNASGERLSETTETVILQMPENATQRETLQEYFGKFCTFFLDPNQHVTRAGGLAPIRF